MKKKIFAITLISAMLSVVGCESKKSETDGQSETTVPEITASETTLSETADTPDTSEDNSETSEKTEVEDSTVKRVLPTKTPVDLIDTQGFEQVGDLGVHQNGFGTDRNGLYSIGVPAWNNSNTSAVLGEAPVVAIIDSGIDYNHPDFKDKIVDMTKYSSLGGRYGYNCSGDGPEDDPMDDDGHGTHCAGIVAAAWDGVGTGGVSSDVQLCIVRASVGGGFDDNNTLRAFNYLIDAVDNGLNLYAVNCSFGGEGLTQAQRQAVEELGKRGVIVVAASGNFQFDNDESDNSASSYSVSPYTIIVNSANFSGYPSDFTHFGQTTTDLFAPGDAILSTVSKKSASYFATIDKNRLMYDGFEENSSLKSRVTIREYGAVNVVENTMLRFDNSKVFAKWIDSTDTVGSRISTSDSYDGDGWVYELTVPGLSKGERAVYVVSVPIEEDQAAAASCISAALKSSLNHPRVWMTPLTFGDDSEEAEINADIGSNDGWRRNGKVWVNKSASYYDDNDMGMSEYAYYKGCIYYAVIVEDYDRTNTESKLYIDSCGMGYSTLRYDYFQGTSMATPMITGSTAVIYSNLAASGELNGLTPSEKAVYVANTVKASVRQYENMDSLCTSQGAFSFEVEKENYVPVINYVKQDGINVTLDGQYFGETTGTAVLGGKTCKVVEWNDRKVVLELPKDMENGRYLLELTAANGCETIRKIVVSGLKGKELLGERVQLPDELKNAYIRTMTSIDDILYVIPQTLTGGQTSALIENQLWSYNPKNNTWNRCKDIPLADEIIAEDTKQYAMIANYNGYLVVKVTYRIKLKGNSYVGDFEVYNPEEYTDLMYFYNPVKDQWIKMDIKDKVNGHGIVFGTDYGVFYCGGLSAIIKNDSTTLETGEIIDYSYTELECSNEIYMLDFDEKALESAGDTIEVTLTSVGESGKSYSGNASVTSYGNRVFLTDMSYEWLEWSEKDRKFTSIYSGPLPEEINVVGTEGTSVCYAAKFVGVITKEGTLFTALSGDDYTGRGYDTFFYSPDGKIVPYEKKVAFGDLYGPIASYSNGYLYVFGSYCYNGDGSLGYLTYMKME